MTRAAVVTFSIGFIAVFLNACGDSAEDENQFISGKENSTPSVYFLQGDVRSLTENSDSNLDSFLSLGELNSYRDFHLAGFHLFTSQSKLNLSESDTGDQKIVVEDPLTQPNDESEPVVLDRYEFSQDQNRYRYQAQNSASHPVFFFKPTAANKLEITALETAGSDYLEIKPIHYSIRADLSLFSILFSFQKDGAEHLGSIIFSKNLAPSIDPIRTEQPYSYLAGRGVGAKWNQPIEFSICGAKALAYKETIIAGIKAWDTENDGTIGGITYKIREVLKPRPFSDVNQNCIYAVEGYRQERRPDQAVLGIALMAVNPTMASIEAATTFLFIDAHKRVNREVSLQTTATHETGHMLGLGHEFALDDQGNPKYQSVMSYNGVDQVTSWDLAAIGGLYPENSSKLDSTGENSAADTVKRMDKTFNESPDDTNSQQTNVTTSFSGF